MLPQRASAGLTVHEGQKHWTCDTWRPSCGRQANLCRASGARYFYCYFTRP